MTIAVHWFRNDLRLHDNPALVEAINNAEKLITLYIFDEKTLNTKLIGYNPMRFILESLNDLNKNLTLNGGRLYILQGNPVDIFKRIKEQIGLDLITFEQNYELAEKKLDDLVIKCCHENNIKYMEIVSHTLWNPREIIKRNGGIPTLTLKNFQVIANQIGLPPKPMYLNIDWSTVGFGDLSSIFLDEFKEIQNPNPEIFGIFPEVPEVLNPTHRWYGGETIALQKLNERLGFEKKTYFREFYLFRQSNPDLLDPSVSLSTALRYGCLSIRILYWELTKLYTDQFGDLLPRYSSTSQLIWREYFYTRYSDNENFDQENPVCITIPWNNIEIEENRIMLECWKNGKTGYPFIDAGMRQLMQEGWIHHVVRIAVACFLTTGNLWINWTEGLNHFLKYLIDGNYSVCAGNWLWILSSAFEQNMLDGSLYICPVKYGLKLDPSGEYIKRYVPELKNIPNEYIHKPWECPESIQKNFGCIIGKDYPNSIVDHSIVSHENEKKITALRIALMNKSEMFQPNPSDQMDTQEYIMCLPEKCVQQNVYDAFADFKPKVDEAQEYNVTVKREIKQLNTCGIRSESFLKKKVKDLVFDYVVDEMHPLDICEKSSFQKLILGLTGSNDCSIIPNRKHLFSRLEMNYKKYTSKITDLIENHSYVCVTADVWSTTNRSYLGMTCHFIDNNNYERQSYVLGIRRVKDVHKYQNILEIISELTQQYKIDHSKITHIVTGNNVNFGNVFHTHTARSYGINAGLNEKIADITVDEWDDSVLNYEIVNVNDLLVTSKLGQLISDNLLLLPHVHCFTQTLDFIADNDVSKISNAYYDNIFKSTITKLSHFWNTASRSTTAADTIYDTCKIKFPVPIISKWRSFYEATQMILNHKNDIILAFEKLCWPKLEANEWKFVEEYCKVMGLLALSVDRLQNDKTYFGHIAPTILVLRTSLIDTKNLMYCVPLVYTIVNSLEERFNFVFDLSDTNSKEFILASLSHPKFKLNWVPVRFQDLCTKLFIDECNLMLTATNTCPKSGFMDDDSDDCSDQEFYNLCKPMYKNIASLQVLNYLSTKKQNLDLLNEYPMIKQIFFKYNTTLPSSAPMKRLFGEAIQVLTSKRNRPNLKTFNMLLCCKSK